MRDTVELLEAIGRDASLRRASPEELARALEADGASPGLLDMAAHGDSAALTAELGLKHMHVEHQSQTGGHEGEDPDEPCDDGDDGDEEPSERHDDTNDSSAA
ncbi:hypothetical protein [Luteibacter sp. SG786]|uniref:hypothetical protein n=1 Tax=Luteibacter sp. SG786 TaxID=2587130 RepID=UPI0014219E41|nr:hypothetical protein [Luteibacter sp. SG786]NII54593.1 hypothetical protein [Luteibacter sp. SG786]